jgi:hypothetical protein
MQLLKTSLKICCYTGMRKAIIMVCAFLMPVFCIAQKPAPLAHGTVFGTNPNTTAMLNASEVESCFG